MKKLLILLCLSNSLFAADFCWSNYEHATYLKPAYNTVQCQDGDRFKIKSNSLDNGPTDLSKKLEKIMISKGYELVSPANIKHGQRVPAIFVKDIPRSLNYCVSTSILKKQTLICIQNKNFAMKLPSFFLLAKTQKAMQDFLKLKGFSKIVDVPSTPKSIRDDIKAKFTIYASNMKSDLCDSKAIEKPFTMSCI